MPIGSSAWYEMEVLDQCAEATDLVSRVTRMAHLESVEAHRDEPLDACPIAIDARMRDDRQSASVVNETNRVADVEPLLGDVRRPAITKPPVEDLAWIQGPAAGDHRARDMRPPDRSARRLREYAVQRDGDAERIELIDHSAGTVETRGSKLPHRDLDQVEALEVKSENVYLAAVIIGAQLDARDDAQAEPLTGASGRVDAGDGVVIGERDRAQAGRSCRCGDVLRRPRAVGRRRVHVQVDGAHGRRATARAGTHEAYPASGDVKLGCDWSNSSRSSASFISPSETSRARAPCGE